MTRSWQRHIAAAAQEVACEFADRVDPDEKTYNSYTSLKEVRQEIEEVLDAAIADWLLENADEPPRRAGPERVVGVCLAEGDSSMIQERGR